MTALNPYLPQDRLHALARGVELPKRTAGAALFADISGFTPLTEGLRDALGPREGAEALTRYLDEVYSALIDQIESFGGSVIGFAGDSVTCWFDDSNGPAGPRAAAAGFGLQSAMQAFSDISLSGGSAAALSLKVAVATGPARRFPVGDPEIGLLDALAGGPVARMATAEHLANPGEILLDEATVHALGAPLSVSEWRTSPETGERFAVAAAYDATVTPHRFDPLPELAAETLRPWLQKAVAERLESGRGGFLTEFRPCTAVFVRFTGLDFESDEAERQLNEFIRQAQSILLASDGVLIQITIGDKGSYLHINYGALSAYEDTPRRAVRAARALLELGDRLGTLDPLQIGIAQGVMRVGAYGGRNRRSYDVLGDDVNLAARLMQTAAQGEILLSGPAYQATAEDFVFEPRPPLPMKGKAEPLPVFAVTGERKRRAIRLQEPNYALPMVGRQAELAAIEEKLDLSLAGRSQVIGIVAEAGIGKSRLVAEAIRAARSKGFSGYGGACQSDGTHTPYLAWKPILGAFFDVDPDAAVRRQVRWLETELEYRAPERHQALPLLGRLLDIPIPENEYTESLEPKARQSELHALLEQCLRSGIQEEPLLFVIEDLHWVDPLSHDLLEQFAVAFADLPVCFILAYRPPEIHRLQDPRLEALPQFTRIELSELSRTEAMQAIRAKLAQLYPARSGSLPAELSDRLISISQGNPFYLEELLNYLRDRGLDPGDPEAMQKIELPDSLHTLILSRIDQLSSREKTTLRVASIIGRLFRAGWLTGYYPELGTRGQVREDLEELDSLEITRLDSPDPELSYLFKHIVTHEVTYENLPLATRSRLHERLAEYLENTYPDSLPLEALALHYGRSANAEKARLYFSLAGDAAFQMFALEGALKNYEQAITWAERTAADNQDVIHLHLQRGRTLELMLRHSEALETYQSLEAMGDALDDDRLRLAGISSQGSIHSYLLDYDAANARLVEALALARKLGDRRSEARNLWSLMRNHFWSDAEKALAYGEGALVIARDLVSRPDVKRDEVEQLALILMDFSFPLIGKGQIGLAQERTAEAKQLFEKLGNLPMVATAAQRLGAALKEEGKLDDAERVFLESIEIDKAIGNEGGQVGTTVGLLDLYPNLGDFDRYFSVLDAVRPIIQREGRIPMELVDVYPLIAYYHMAAVDETLNLKADMERFVETGMPIWMSYICCIAALIYIQAGRLEEARRWIDRIDTGYDASNTLLPLTTLVPRVQAEMALAEGEAETGLAIMDELLEKVEKQGGLRHLPLCLHLKARLLLASGRTGEGAAVLVRAERLALEQNFRTAVWQICGLLGKLALDDGSQEAAVNYFARARAAVDFIAGHPGRESLRKSFLAIPLVRTILENT